MADETSTTAESPRWNTLTKFLVALVGMVLLGALLSRFQQLIPPLGLAFIIAYLLNPVADWVVARTHWKWGVAVTVVFLTIVLLLITILTVAGIALVQEITGLYNVIAEILPELPERVQAIVSQPIHLGPFTLDPTRPFNIGPFGPFVIDLSQIDLQPLYDQLLAIIQPALQQTGTLVGSLASGTANALGWFLFILIVSYYWLHDLKNLLPSLEHVVPAGYAPDMHRLAQELGPIWNAFLRGQVTLALVMGIVVGITMAVLGVRYAPVLGLLAGLLEFIPIVGPIIAGGVAVLVALFQPTNWLGWSPVYFALLILGVQVLLQQLENNFLVPRIIGGSLNLHPIIILVGAIVGANLAGITGLLLSAPVIASLRLFGGYIYRKMFDLDPWPNPPPQPEAPRPSEWPRWFTRLVLALRKQFTARTKTRKT